jgi:hypothetical protein
LFTFVNSLQVGFKISALNQPPSYNTFMKNVYGRGDSSNIPIDAPDLLAPPLIRSGSAIRIPKHLIFMQFILMSH